MLLLNFSRGEERTTVCSERDKAAHINQFGLVCALDQSDSIRMRRSTEDSLGYPAHTARQKQSDGERPAVKRIDEGCNDTNQSELGKHKLIVY